MQILDDGVEKVMVDFQVEMEDRERVILFDYARDTITEEEYENMMINWGIVDILQKQVDALKTS